jgi:uncharacterized protein YndB with AHSA1/START domain
MNRSLVVEQHVAAEPARVYAAWVSAEALETWWWPQIPDTTYDVDARVGGTYRIWSQQAGIGVQGEFLALDEPHEIGMTWEWLTEGEESVREQVWVRFTPVEGGTTVTVTHQLHEISGSGESQRQGWDYVLARLAEAHARV